jgi:hypothetical protein
LSHDGWLTIPGDSLAEVLTPHGHDAQPGDGLGDFHLQAAGYEMSCAFEDVGWQVIFDGDAAGVDTDELVAQSPDRFSIPAGPPPTGFGSPDLSRRVIGDQWEPHR